MKEEGKIYRVRFKKDGKSYKTAVVNGEDKFEYNTAVKVMNKLKDKEIACWAFKDGEERAVIQYIPDDTEEIEL